MATLKVCDRCGGDCTWPDERALEQFRKDYPTLLQGQDICTDCAGRIDLAAQNGAHAAVEGISPAEYARRWADLYQNKEP